MGPVLNKVDERIGAYGNYEYKYSYYGESDTEKNSPKYLIRRNVSMSNKSSRKQQLWIIRSYGFRTCRSNRSTKNQLMLVQQQKMVKKLSFKKKGYVISASGHWMNAKTRLKFSPKSAKTL